MKLRDAAPALGVFGVALGYLLLLRPYGFQLEDEGTQLFWFDRVLRGQQPYLDFHTGYTPGFFAFGTAVFSLFGASATALRAVLAVVNALTAAGLTEVTRRVAGRWLAPLPALLWLAFMPVYVGEFAAFNIPYPTWPVTLAWVGIALAMLGWIEKPRAGLLVLAGAGAALAMWFRPNSGAFALAASTWIVVAAASRQSTLDRIAAFSATTFMALGVWYTFEFRVVGIDAMVHLVPTFTLALLCAGPLADKLLRAPTSGDAAEIAVSHATASTSSVCAALTVLAAAFLIPTLAWTLPLLSMLGRERFLYEVFLVGADYQSLYYKPHPAPEIYAVLVVAAMVAIAVAGRLIARQRLRPTTALLSIVLVGGLVKLAILGHGVAPEGWIHSVVAQLENAAFWLAAMTTFGATFWLWRVSARELQLSARARAMLVVTPLGAAMYLQMFPRSDFMHQISAVPLLVVAACGLLHRVVLWWSRGEWPAGWSGRTVMRRGVRVAAAGTLLLVFGEKVSGPIRAWTMPAPQAVMPARLHVQVERAAGDELEAIASTVAYLKANTDEGEALWSFPATSGLLFAAERTNVAPHDYWYPGRPDRDEEAKVLTLLRQQRPRFIVTLGHGWNFFAEAPVYFEPLRSYVIKEYRLAARFGRYDVLGRRDVLDDSNPRTRKGRVAGTNAQAWVIDGNLERRRQATWRWMDALTANEAAKAVLPQDRRQALLLLRGLRDGGDMRGAGWAIVGFESTDPRIRREAVDAMLALTQALRSEKARFAGDFDVARYRAYLAPWVQRVRPLEDVEGLEPFASAVRELGSPAAALNPGN